MAAVGTGNTAPGLTTAAILLFVWSSLTFVVRVWVKLKKIDNWGVDDSTISASIFFALLHVTTTVYAIKHGYGNIWPSLDGQDRDIIEKAIYASQLFYVASVGLTRVSTSFFNARLTRDKRHTSLAHTTSVLCALWVVASLFAIAIRAPVSAPWQIHEGTYSMYLRWMGTEVSGLALDLTLWTTSIYLIWGLHMPTSKRISVSTILTCRVGVVPIVAMRLWYLSPSKNSDPTTNPAMTANVYTEAAINFAFMLSSITCLKPFLRPFHGGYFVSTGNDTGGRKASSGYPALSGKSAGSRGDAYYMLSTTRSTQRGDDKDETGVVAVEAPKAVFRSDHTDHHSAVQSDAIERGHRHLSVSAGSEDMIISKMQTWAVTYEGDKLQDPHAR